MEWVYPARYSDRRGIELSTIRNDVAKLTLRLRGVTFCGRDFDGLVADPQSAPNDLAAFDRHDGELCNCTIECRIPILVVSAGGTSECNLEMHLELGSSASNGRLDRELLTLSTDVDGQIFRSEEKRPYFEHELLSLQSSLPSGSYIKACISCALSDYSPFGNGLFGGMAYLRNLEMEYSKVRDKYDLIAILDRAEVVQETYLCSRFAKPWPDTGIAADTTTVSKTRDAAILNPVKLPRRSLKCRESHYCY